MEIFIFFMALMAVTSYFYKQLFLEATFSISEIMIISISEAVVIQDIHNMIIKLIHYAKNKRI